MNNNIIKYVLVLGAVFYAGTSNAVPHTFKAGDPASAQQVNENFKSLEDRLTVYDYRDFSRSSNITKKIFSLFDSKNTCNKKEERTYEEKIVGDNMEVRVTRIRKNDLNEPCRHTVFNYLKTPSQRLRISEESWDISGPTHNSTATYDTPFLTRSSEMIVGMTYGSASTITVQPVIGDAFIGVNKVSTFVAHGLEDVTVPAGSFTACLKISSQLEVGIRFSWHCPGVGEVKRIQRILSILPGPQVFYRSNTWQLTEMVTK